MPEPADAVPSPRPTRPIWKRPMAWALVVTLLWPYGLLLLISFGSGWAFPTLLPNRLDFAAWRHFASDRDEIATAVRTSAGMSLLVATVSTFGGMLIGRAIRRSRSAVWRFLVYLPFAVSPVVVAVCLYDMLVRLGLAGSITGVVLLQTMFALAFAAVFFSELWSPRAERLELLVRGLGGNNWAVWRHAILPRASGLILVCLMQTALYSWLDYGLVSVVGGGQVPSVTMKLFGYIHEGSVNQAAQAGLVLLCPTLIAFSLAGCVYALHARS